MTRIVQDDKNPDRLAAVCPDGSLSGELFAVDPSGHLVSVPPSFKMKAGWAWATKIDVERADASEAARLKAAKANTATAKAE